ncbi:MAG: acylneuraminate cytidylyltransferase family protein [Anaerolineaceae bacterium]|jgi:CMP-N-acetylneuraminic acid synthetase|nr:acylneuraminate cytidylyltransferase family protein [Anaerolineaceae bacterium]
MKNIKIAALVPMRHHSQRVPGKNFRDLAGKPLFHYILDTLSQCPEISQIAVNTDSEVIQMDIEKNYPGIAVLIRPERLRADSIPMNEILMYDTGQIPADLYLQTHCTNPLLKASTISKAINEFSRQSPQYDSLFSVTRLQTRLWDQYTQPVNHDPDVLLQTQDLPPIFEENSCIYVFTAENLKRRGNRIGENPMMFEISIEEALDIDDESDFLIADLLMKNRLKR